MPTERSPSRAETPRRYSVGDQCDMDINELRRTLVEQQRMIERMQQQQQTASGIPNQGITYVTEGNLAHFSIRDALEAVPTFDGENIAFVYFVEGCEEALSMIAPTQENTLTRAVRNKLKGDAHRSILGRTFSNMRELVEFLRAKYGPRETVYEAQGRLAYLCQKRDEKVSAYANRVRELGKRIIDAQRREVGFISPEFKHSIEEHLKTSFLRGLNKDLIISKDGTFEEVESRAIDAEKELETINMIRRVVLAENTTTEKRAPTRRVNAEEITCQFCQKKGHTADRCRGIPKNIRDNQGYNNQGYNNNNHIRNSDRTNFNPPQNRMQNQSQNQLQNPWQNRSQNQFSQYQSLNPFPQNQRKNFIPQNFTPQDPPNNFPNFPTNAGSSQRAQNFNNFFQPNSGNRYNQINSTIICRYCKKPGHTIEECRRRLYNTNQNNYGNNNRNNYGNNYQQFGQNQGNQQTPEKTGATSGTTNTRPTRAVSVEQTNLEQ